MSDPHEPSNPEPTENTPVTPDPSAPPFPSGMPTPATPEAPSAPPAPSAPSYGPPSIPGSTPSAPSYGAPSVYGTTPSPSSSAPTPAHGSTSSPAGAPPSAQLPYSAPYAPGQVPPTRKLGWMGIVSIILGGLALLVCWVPFLNFVTVFGAIGGLVFGLIALFRKFGSRVLSLIGTIVSGIAFILSIVFIVIYTISFVSAIDSGSKGDDTPATSKPSSTPSQTDSSDSSPFPGDPTVVPGDPKPSAGAAVCTDGTAIALGKTGIFTYDGENQAEVTIEDAKLDATAEMLNDNTFNATPPDGYQYALISVTVKQLGTQAFPAGATDAIFKGVAANVAAPAQTALVPEPWMLFAPDLTPGASVTGNIAVYVPTSGAETGSVLVSNYLGDNVCEMKLG